MYGQVETGQDVWLWVVCHDPITGAATNADGSVWLYYRINDGSESFIDFGISAKNGVYRVRLPGDVGNVGDNVSCWALATVGGVMGNTVCGNIVRVAPANGGGGLSQQDVRDAMTLGTQEVPQSGSIDEMIDKTPQNTWATPGRTVEGGTITTCQTNEDMRGTDGASTHGPADVSVQGSYADGSVWWSPNGTSGTTPGVNGTQTNPVDNLADALALCSAMAIENIAVAGIVSAATDENLGTKRLRRAGPYGTINLSGNLTANLAEFDGVEISYQAGSITSGATTIFRNTNVNLTGFGDQAATFYDCTLTGSVLWSPAFNTGMYDCRMSSASDLRISLPPVFMLNGFKGKIILAGGNAATIYRLENVEGEVEFEEGFAATSVILTGRGKLTDNWGGNLDREGFVDHDPAAVWTHPDRSLTANATGEYADGAVWVNPDGTPGTTLGVNGTQQKPVTTVEDALAICTASGLDKIHLAGNVLLQGDITLGEIVIYGSIPTNATLTLNGHTCDANNTTFRRLTLSQFGGTLVSNSQTAYEDCSIPTSMLPNGNFVRCFMNGTVLRPVTNSSMRDCYGKGNRLAIELPANFYLHGYRGWLRLDEGVATSTYRITDVEGVVEIDPSVNLTTGSIILTGKGTVTDNGTNSNLDRTGFYNETHIEGTTPEAIWNHPERELTKNLLGEYADGAVWVHPDGNPGFVAGVNGTQSNPVPTLNEANTIAQFLHLKRIVIADGIVEGSSEESRVYLVDTDVDWSSFELVGIGRAQIAVIPGGELLLSNAVIRGIDVAAAGGTLTANGNTKWIDCPIQAAHPGGQYWHCQFLTTSLTPTVTSTRLRDCFSPEDGLTINLPTSFAGVGNHGGSLIIQGAGPGDIVPLVGIEGDVTIGASNDAGSTFIVTGKGRFSNASGATAHTDGFYDGSVLIEGTKKTLDDLNDVSTTDVFEQSDQALRGQRLHELMNEPDVGLPGADSLLGKMITTPSYNINGRQFTDAALELATATTTGQAQAGTADTITLANFEPGDPEDDNVFQGSIIAIQSGTGRKQVRTITAYTAATRVATVTPGWNTAPDATSHYTVYPGPTAGAQGGGNDVNVVSVAGEAISNQAGQNLQYHYDNNNTPTTKVVEDTGVAGTGLTPQAVRDAMQLDPTTPGANAEHSIDERLTRDKRIEDIWDTLPSALGGGAGPVPGSLGEFQTASSIDPQQVRDAMKLAPSVGDPASGSIDERVSQASRRTDVWLAPDSLDDADTMGFWQVLQTVVEPAPQPTDNAKAVWDYLSSSGNQTDPLIPGSMRALQEQSPSDLTWIDNVPVAGGDAILRLKQLRLQNDSGIPLIISSNLGGIGSNDNPAVFIEADNQQSGTAHGVEINSKKQFSSGVFVSGGPSGVGATIGNVGNNSNLIGLLLDGSSKDIDAGEIDAISGKTSQLTFDGPNVLADVMVMDTSALLQFVEQALAAPSFDIGSVAGYSRNTATELGDGVWNTLLGPGVHDPNSAGERLYNLSAGNPIQIVVTPITAITGDTIDIANNVTVDQFSSKPDLTFTIKDAEGDPVDLTGKQVEFTVFNIKNPDKILFYRSTVEPPGGVSIIGNEVTVDYSADDTAVDGVWLYTLWNMTDGQVLGRGQFTIRRAVNTEWVQPAPPIVTIDSPTQVTMSGLDADVTSVQLLRNGIIIEQRDDLDQKPDPTTPEVFTLDPALDVGNVVTGAQKTATNGRWSRHSDPVTYTG